MTKRITRRQYDIARWIIDHPPTLGTCPWKSFSSDPDGRFMCDECYEYAGIRKPDVITKDGLCCPCNAMGIRELVKVLRKCIDTYEQENGRPYE